jgi:hypothetical protein
LVSKLVYTACELGVWKHLTGSISGRCAAPLILQELIEQGLIIRLLREARRDG